MASLRMLVLKFETPFKFGWSEPLPYIDASSIARAVFYVFTSTLPDRKIAELANALRQGELKFSSILPLAQSDEGELMPLVPTPRLPKLGKEVPAWIPLSTAVSLLTKALECISSGGEPIIRVPRNGNKIETLCMVDGKDRSLGTISLPEPKHRIEEAIKSIDIYHNVLDRVGMAADVYRVSGYLHRPYSYLLIHCRDELYEYVLNALKVLQHLGLGGRRGKGFGRFRIVEEIDANGFMGKHLVSNSVIPMLKPNSLCMNLGRFSPRDLDSIDFDKSFIALTRLEGFSGNVINYLIPGASSLCIDIGSVIMPRKQDPGEVLTYSTEITFLKAPPALPLNPLFLCAVS